MSASRILVVDDDTNLLKALEYSLEEEGYQVSGATDGSQALEVARREEPDLILLDIMLPGLNGFEVCRILRKETAVPIVMLTAKTDETDKVVGLELGADDYITKPFHMRELLARIAAMLRRFAAARQDLPPSTEAATSVVKAGDLEIDIARHEISRGGAAVGLSPREFALLAFLAKNRGHVCSRDQIMEKVWGNDYAGSARTVDVHVVSLRRKLEDDPSNPLYLLTVRGFGYKLEG